MQVTSTITDKFLNLKESYESLLCAITGHTVTVTFLAARPSERFRLAPLVRITVRTRRVEHRSAGEAIRCPGDDVAPGRADSDASCVRAELMHKLQGEKA